MSRLRRQAGKLLEFALPPGGDRVALEPHPWRRGRHAGYFLIHSLDNSDGFGGYTRTHRFDEDGVPYLPHGRLRRYEPLVVARYAMQMLHIGAAQIDPLIARKGRAMLPFLAASGRSTGIWGRGADPYEMSAASPMCITQGVVISALLRLTDGRPGFEISSLIDRAFRILTKEVERGGTLSRLAGLPFLEEYPGTPPSHVLNGCLYALLGLYDMADALGEERAGSLAAGIERSLGRSIDRFVTRSGWSYYALNLFGRPYLASLHYHRQHIRLCRVVAERTGDPGLARACATWQAALDSRRDRLRAGAAKTVQVIWMRQIRRHPLGDG